MSLARDIADLAAVTSRLDTLGASSNALSNRNLFVNGAALIDQRNSGSAVTPTSDQTYTLDRFQARLNNASKYSVQQVADAPSGFYNSLKVTSAAATTVGTNDYYQINTPIEGYLTDVLQQGTSAAKQYTLSFYVKSSLTGTFGGAYSNNQGDRLYAWTYTIDAANTWERKSITITGATDGTWLQTTNAGMWIYWTLGAGSGVQTTAGAWGTSFKRGPTGATNVVATSGATWQITGVQLEVGSTATDFEHKNYRDELAAARRYYEVILPASRTQGKTHNPSGTQCHFSLPYKETKRATPSLVVAKGSISQVYDGTNAVTSGFTIDSDGISADSITWRANLSSGLGGSTYKNISGYDIICHVDAEL